MFRRVLLREKRKGKKGRIRHCPFSLSAWMGKEGRRVGITGNVMENLNCCGHGCVLVRCTESPAVRGTSCYGLTADPLPRFFTQEKARLPKTVPHSWGPPTLLVLLVQYPLLFSWSSLYRYRHRDTDRYRYRCRIWLQRF